MSSSGAVVQWWRGVISSPKLFELGFTSLVLFIQYCLGGDLVEQAGRGVGGGRSPCPQEKNKCQATKQLQNMLLYIKPSHRLGPYSSS